MFVLLIATVRVWIAVLVILSIFLPMLFFYIPKRIIAFNKNFFLFIMIFLFVGIIFFLDTNLWNETKINFIQSQFDRVHNWHAWDPNHYDIIGINAENIKQLILYDYWKMMFLTIFNHFLIYYYKLQFYPFIFENMVIIFLIIYQS